MNNHRSLQSKPLSKGRCNASHANNIHLDLPLNRFCFLFAPIKAYLQALACHCKYCHNEKLPMQTKDVRSEDYALGTTRSQECAHPTKIGSRSGWSFPLLIMIHDNSNISTMLREAPTTCISIHRDLLEH